MKNKDVTKTGLQVLSAIPIDAISTPANVIYNVASITGAFDKEGMDLMTEKEIFYDFLFDGRVVDEEKAKVGNCKCTVIHPFNLPDKEKRVCWKPGILGVLTQEQVEKYCPAEKTITEETTNESRIIKFIEASDNCEYGKIYKNNKIEEISQRIECMMDELKKHGLEITEI
jgi:hypothetical protein